jgi:hypothetical protein
MSGARSPATKIGRFLERTIPLFAGCDTPGARGLTGGGRGIDEGGKMIDEGGKMIDEGG